MAISEDLSAARGRLTDAHLDAMIGAGIDQGILFERLGGFRGSFGISPISISDNLFEPAEDGPEAWIFPTDFYYDLDLVAWLPGNPRHWWRRRVHAIFLEHDGVLRSAFFNQPLTSATFFPLAPMRASSIVTASLLVKAKRVIKAKSPTIAGLKFFALSAK